MKRRSFLTSLIALPAGLVAAAKAAPKLPARQLWFVDWKDIKLPPVREGCACSLTHTTIMPLTPEHLVAMANDEADISEFLRKRTNS